MNDLESALRKERERFLAPTPAPRRRPDVARPYPGIKVVLVVRKGRLKPDEVFEYQSNTVSRLDARLQAEAAARQAGYQIGHVRHYYQP